MRAQSHVYGSPDAPAVRGEISEGGDSGSLWMVDSADDADVVLGLHFAGETDPRPEAEHALACNIKSVLEKLDIRLQSHVPAPPPVPDDDGAHTKGNGAPVPSGDGYLATLPLGVRAVVERLDAPPELRLGYDRNFLVEESVPAGLVSLLRAEPMMTNATSASGMMKRFFLYQGREAFA